MARYRIVLEQEEFVVEIDEHQVRINGELVDPGLVSILNEHGLLFFEQGEEKKEIHIQHQDRNQYAVQIDGHHLTAEVERDRGGMSRARNGTRQDSGEVLAPMPAMVIDVLVVEGARVAAGEDVLILEAMKMQMRIQSPCAGTVVNITAEAGKRVEKGEVLLRVKPDGEGESSD
ncbi:MAG: hypothetical protein JW750_01210 [Anaerolineaceae bacterium]|nr:hypothetical protein [Anaerolineaceae bacterium]